MSLDLAMIVCKGETKAGREQFRGARPRSLTRPLVPAAVALPLP
jgi:hypothetical protein